MGEVILFLKQHNEQYRITYPEMYLRGIISGKIFTEITGETYIKSSNGLVGHINHIAYEGVASVSGTQFFFFLCVCVWCVWAGGFTARVGSLVITTASRAVCTMKTRSP